jgi:hypothetical protein
MVVSPSSFRKFFQAFTAERTAMVMKNYTRRSGNQSPPGIA